MFRSYYTSYTGLKNAYQGVLSPNLKEADHINSQKWSSIIEHTNLRLELTKDTKPYEAKTESAISKCKPH